MAERRREIDMATSVVRGVISGGSPDAVGCGRPGSDAFADASPGTVRNLGAPAAADSGNFRTNATRAWRDPTPKAESKVPSTARCCRVDRRADVDNRVDPAAHLGSCHGRICTEVRRSDAPTPPKFRTSAQRNPTSARRYGAARESGGGEDDLGAGLAVALGHDRDHRPVRPEHGVRPVETDRGQRAAVGQHDRLVRRRVASREEPGRRLVQRQRDR